MTEVFNQLLGQTQGWITYLTGYTVPPVILVIALIAAIAKGLKTLSKIVSVLLALYFIYLLFDAGVIQNFVESVI